MKKYDQLASEQEIQTTVQGLNLNGFATVVVATGEEAKTKALELITEKSEVFTATSQTVDTIGLGSEINESGRFISVRNRVAKMDSNTQGLEKRRIGSAADWVVGSVHAVTQDGHVLVASASGSQLPAYIFGASSVLWIVSTKKITQNIEDGTRRIYDYVFPLENARAQKAYGANSSVNFLLTINKQRPGRATIILVKELLGF